MRIALLLLALLLSAAAGAATPATLNKHCNLQARYLLAAEEIRFAPSRTIPGGGADSIIDALALIATDCPDSIVVIEGHTDNRGDEAMNRRLSEARASAVAAALHKRGIPAARTRALGFGASRPLSDNATRDGRRANRRIEIRFRLNRNR